MCIRDSYVCAKFRFCGDLSCWASPWRKIAYSINQSLITHSVTHPAYLMPRKPKLSLWNMQIFSFIIRQVTWLVVAEVRSESFGLVTELCHEIGVLYAVSHIVAQWTSLTLTHVIFFIVECGIAHFLCAMRILKVRASSSSPRPLTHPAYLMPRKPQLSLRNNNSYWWASWKKFRRHPWNQRYWSSLREGYFYVLHPCTHALFFYPSTPERTSLH